MAQVPSEDSVAKTFADRRRGPALSAFSDGSVPIPSPSNRHLPEPRLALGGLEVASPSGLGPMLWTAHQRYRQHTRKLQEKRQPKAKRSGSVRPLVSPECEELSQRLVRCVGWWSHPRFKRRCLLLRQQCCDWIIHRFGFRT